MTDLKQVIRNDYAYQTAGHTWLVREAALTELPGGKLGMSLEQIRRVNYAIANEICGTAGSLTFEEFDFLCATTITTYKEAADYLGIHRTTITKWKRPGTTIQPIFSISLKKWFWFKLFGDGLSNRTVPFHKIRNEADFLKFAKEIAIEKQLVTRIEQKVA